jgi:hypothetical protein
VPSASATRQHLGDDLSPSGEAQTTTHYTVGLGVTAFELDLFGRVRSLSAAALEQYLATEEARRSAHLSLVAEVATQYLAERALEDQVTLARQTLETVESSLALTRRTYEAGRTSELDVRTAETQVQTARFNLSRAPAARAGGERPRPARRAAAACGPAAAAAARRADAPRRAAAWRSVRRAAAAAGHPRRSAHALAASAASRPLPTRVEREMATRTTVQPPTRRRRSSTGRALGGLPDHATDFASRFAVAGGPPSRYWILGPDTRRFGHGGQPCLPGSKLHSAGRTWWRASCGSDTCTSSTS